MVSIDFLNPNKARALFFLKHLCYVIKKNEEKEDAKNQILEKVDRLRSKIKSTKSTKKELVALVTDLENDIDFAIQKGVHLHQKNRKINPGYRSISKRVHNIDNDVKDYLINFTNRLKKIEEIEKDMKTHSVKKVHKKKLLTIEKKIKEIESINTTDVKQMNRIKKKLTELKNKLV